MELDLRQDRDRILGSSSSGPPVVPSGSSAVPSAASLWPHCGTMLRRSPLASLTVAKEKKKEAILLPGCQACLILVDVLVDRCGGASHVADGSTMSSFVAPLRHGPGQGQGHGPWSMVHGPCPPSCLVSVASMTIHPTTHGRGMGWTGHGMTASSFCELKHQAARAESQAYPCCVCVSASASALPLRFQTPTSSSAVLPLQATPRWLLLVGLSYCCCCCLLSSLLRTVELKPHVSDTQPPWSCFTAIVIVNPTQPLFFNRRRLSALPFPPNNSGERPIRHSKIRKASATTTTTTSWANRAPRGSGTDTCSVTQTDPNPVLPRRPPSAALQPAAAHTTPSKVGR